jgi:myo-inositol-1(or 4)-monophosphatase
VDESDRAGELGGLGFTAFLSWQLAAASQVALSYFGQVSAVFKDGDPAQVLTEADVMIGRMLVAAVRSAYPDHNVIDEETGVVDHRSRYTWVIDPIEATGNFAAGLPDFGIMIGLLDGAAPVAGGIAVPAHGRTYLAERGRGATCNGTSIRASAEHDLERALMSFGFDADRADPARTLQATGLLAAIALACGGTVNSGCEAVDPMYVADGRLGGRVNLCSRIWDNVAPQIIAEEAGAVWTAADGTPLDYTHPTERAAQNFAFCVAAPALHRPLTEVPPSAGTVFQIRRVSGPPMVPSRPGHPAQERRPSARPSGPRRHQAPRPRRLCWRGRQASSCR